MTTIADTIAKSTFVAASRPADFVVSATPAAAQAAV